MSAVTCAVADKNRPAQPIIAPVDGRGIPHKVFAHAPAHLTQTPQAPTPNRTAHVHTHPHPHTTVIYKQPAKQTPMAMRVIAQHQFKIKKQKKTGIPTMKTLILILTILTITPHIANAACTANAKVYSSCRAGYYLSNSSCIACNIGTYGGGGTSTSCTPCPKHNGVSGTTPNTGSQVSTLCVIYSGSWSFSDSIGSGTERFTGACYYTN